MIAFGCVIVNRPFTRPYSKSLIFIYFTTISKQRMHIIFGWERCLRWTVFEWDETGYLEETHLSDVSW